MSSKSLKEFFDEDSKVNSLLNENFSSFTIKFKKYYVSSEPYTFKEWLSIFSSLMEEIS
jgi:hypothetical protein